MTFSLPRGVVRVSGWQRPSAGSTLDDHDWKPALAALADVIRLATSADARVILAYYPDLLQIYLPHVTPSTPAFHAIQRDHGDAVDRLRRLARQEGAVFVDYTEAMQKGNATAKVTMSDSDYHPNARGVETMTDTVLPVIRRLVGQ